MGSKLQSLLFFAAFVAVSYGYSLECYFMQTDWGMDIGNRYGATCMMDVDDNDFQNLVEITGDHTGHALSDVQYLTVSGQGSMSPGPISLPNLKASFPDIVYLQWNSGALKHLKASDFSSWTNLLSINFQGNQLRSLDGNLFASSPKLRSMDFSMNPIEVIGEGFFNGLNQLTQISFMSAKCLGMNYMYSQTDLNAQKRDIQHLCGPLQVEGDIGECSAFCEDQFTSINTKLAVVEKDELSALQIFRNLIFKN